MTLDCNEMREGRDGLASVAALAGRCTCDEDELLSKSEKLVPRPGEGARRLEVLAAKEAELALLDVLGRRPKRE